MKSAKISKDRHVLRQIVKASDAIRRKHKMIKSDKDTFAQVMQDTLKPIVTPLEGLVKSSRQPIKNEVENRMKNYNSDDDTLREENDEEEDDNTDASFKTVYSNQSGVDIDDIEYDESNVAPNVKQDDLINKYLRMLQADKKTDLDTVYGVRKLARNRLMMGDSPISFEPDFIHVGDQKYDKTEGLIELLFKKIPDDTNINFGDLRNYNDIVVATNAHRQNYKHDEPLRKNSSLKFKNFIEKYIENPSHVGGSIPKYKVARNDMRSDYVYWDDPNELVNRLRLLLAAQAAGNSTHTNEILSIIEELREAGIIY